MELSGHTTAGYNGTYRAVDERDGWPVLQNEDGIWLFRVGSQPGLGDARESWRLWKKHTWDVDECNSYCRSTDGSFPIGEQRWHTYDTATRQFLPLTMTMHVIDTMD